MNKQEFIKQLQKHLSGFSQTEREERLSFYEEMIDDRMEEGLTEEEAVLAAGSLDEIAIQSEENSDHTNLKPKMSVWGMILLILGSPLWISLLIASVCVILSVYITVWSVVVSFWAVFVSMIVCAFAASVYGLGLTISGWTLTGIAGIGAGLVCAGLSIFLFFGCRVLTAAVVRLTKWAARRIRRGGTKEAHR